MVAYAKTYGPALAAAGLVAGVALSLASTGPLALGAAGVAALAAAGVLVRRLREDRRRAADLLAQATAERAVLHGVLAAGPLAWCAWEEGGSLRADPRLPGLLGGRAPERPLDLAAAFPETDAAALRQALGRLERGSDSIEIEVTTVAGRRLAVSGRRMAAAGDCPLSVLWFAEVTEARRQAERLDEAGARAALLAGVLDALPLPVWVRRGDGALLWCNGAYGRAVDATPDAAVADGRELIPAAGRRLAAEALATGLPQSERAATVVSGNRLVLEISELRLPHAHAGGRVAGFAFDRTALEEAGAELRRHLAAHAEVLERLGSAIAIFGPDTRLSFFNQAFVGLWGLDEAWLRSEPLHAEFLEELRARRKLPEYADFQAFKRDRLSRYTQLLEAAEELMHLPDGTALRVLAAPHPLGGLILIMEDVTNTLALESSYNTLIAVQQETLDNLAEGIAVFGGDGRLKLSNPAFARVWELRDADLHGEPHITEVFELMRPFFVESAEAAGDHAAWEALKEEMVGATLDRAVRSGRLERSDGSVVEFSTLPLPDGAVLNSYLDVTDSARLEQALRASNAALEAADQLKSEFIANVSHHLRTPLNAILGFAEVLSNQYFGPLSARQQEYVKGVLSAGSRLLELIDDIVDLTSIGAGVTTLDRGAVDVADLVEAVAGLTREWARREGLRLEVAATGPLGSVPGDAKRLKQALFNLVVTAIRMPPPSGRILLAAERTADQLVLSVGDPTLPPPTGDGLARGEGSGLGLALVRNVIELHGGRLLIDGEPGYGNRIRCVLPARA